MKRQQGKVDIPLAIVSLILGLCVWLFAVSRQGLRDEFTVVVKDIRLRNLPPGLKVTRMPTQWRARLRGAPTDIQRIRKQSDFAPTAYIDLRNAPSSDDLYSIRIDWPSNMGDVDPPEYDRSAPVTLEEISKTTFVLVEVEEFGEIPPGLRYASAGVEPERVDLYGTAADLARVGKVKVLLDISKVESGSAVRLQVIVLDRAGHPIDENRVSADPSVVSVTPSFSATAPRRSVLVSPVWKGQPAPGFQVSRVEVSPNQVTVEGDRKRLADLMQVATEQLSLEGLNRDATFTASLHLPAGIKPSGVKKVTVRVFVQALPANPVVPPTGG